MGEEELFGILDSKRRMAIKLRTLVSGKLLCFATFKSYQIKREVKDQCKIE